MPPRCGSIAASRSCDRRRDHCAPWRPLSLSARRRALRRQPWERLWAADTPRRVITRALCPPPSAARRPAAHPNSPPAAPRTPYVTGTSVLGLTFAGGVLLAADTLGSYGSTKRYKSFERLLKVNDAVIVAAGGELSDFQYIAR